MIVFPNNFPYEITNTSGSTLCGITTGSTKLLGPQDFQGTYNFYSVFAEEAYALLLDGTFTAKAQGGANLTASVAAAAFTNMRSKVLDYAEGTRIAQPYTRFLEPIMIPAFLDTSGATGAPGQALVPGPTGGMVWEEVGGGGPHGVTGNTVPIADGDSSWKNSSISEGTSTVSIGKRTDISSSTSTALSVQANNTTDTWKKIFQVFAPGMTGGQKAQFVFGKQNSTARIAEFAYWDEALNNYCRMTMGLFGVPELLSMYYNKRIVFDVDNAEGYFGIQGVKQNSSVPNLSIGANGALSKTNFFASLKEYSGFLDGDNIQISYDQAARTITLTGDLRYLRNSEEIELTSPWTSPVHGTTNGSWFLYDTGSGMQWSQTPWEFYHVQCAYVWYGTTSSLRFALRETHGLVYWVTHRNEHQTRGLYRVSGGDLDPASYTRAPATPVDTDNRPTWGEATVQDEDLTTVVPASLGSGTYTKLYFDASNNPQFAIDQTHLVIITNNYASYNNAGVMTAVPSGNFINVYTLALPATLDAGSQKFRTVLVYSTSVYSTRDLAIKEDLRSLRLEGVPNLTPEFVITNQITIKVDSSYTTVGYFRIESVQKVEKERYTVITPPAAEGKAVTEPGDSETFNISLSNYTQSINQLVWTTMVFVAKPGKINRMSVFATQATGSGNTRLGVYNSSHVLIAQSNNKTGGLTTGFNEFTFASEVVLTSQSYYYFAVQSRANGAILLGYNATVNPNTPVLARLDSNNAADPLNGMTTPITVSQSQYRVWIRAYYVG